MKEAYWGYWLIVLGLFIIVIMMLIQNVTSSSTEDYYTVKEITEAAMVDAVDYAYYTKYGELRINKEKYIESFIRRFSATTTALTSTYTITFSAIYEAPPKASVEIKSKTNTYVISSDETSFDLTNRVDGILEIGTQNKK